jgi:hypothetical protein
MATERSHFERVLDAATEAYVAHGRCKLAVIIGPKSQFLEVGKGSDLPVGFGQLDIPLMQNGRFGEYTTDHDDEGLHEEYVAFAWQ